MNLLKDRHGDGDDGCAHAAHRSAGAPDALAAAEAACRSRGARLTPIRRDVLGVLFSRHPPPGASELPRPPGPYDNADALAGQGRRKLAPITIYRALEFLMAEGLVHRLASRNAFVACPHQHAPQDLVAFLICEGCGGVDEMSSAPLGRALSGLLEAERFEPHLQVLEISGRCSHCREPAPAEAPR